MLKNCNHDLIHSLSEKSDAVWRYAQEYQKNAKVFGCKSCQNLWKKLQKDDEGHLEMLKREIQRHFTQKRFN